MFGDSEVRLTIGLNGEVYVLGNTIPETLAMEFSLSTATLSVLATLILNCIHRAL